MAMNGETIRFERFFGNGQNVVIVAVDHGMYNLIRDGMVLTDVPVYWQDWVLGFILILAVVFDRVAHRNQ